MTDYLDVYRSLKFPIHFLLCSASYLPVTIFNLIRNLQFSTLFSPTAFKSIWFANFWGAYGPLVKTNAKSRVKPFIDLAHGVVIDVGPGSGEWLSLFDKTKVTKIYGVEPNRDHHDALRKRIIDAGLSDVYIIVPVGIEDLDGKGSHGGEQRKAGWIQPGEADSIITVLTLCSVSNPRDLIKDLYTYLNDGGSWIVYEHIVTRPDAPVRYYQALIDLIWPHFFGGCSITRDTEKWLKEAGPWTKVDLKAPSDQKSYHVLPHTMGTLTK